MKQTVAVLGSPGSGKSSVGLSYPGVEQLVFGSSEETTAFNFTSRKDIAIPYKLDWYSCLTDAERLKFTDEKVSETELGVLMAIARTRNIIKFRRYLYQLKFEFASGKPVIRKNANGEEFELQTIFLDNGTPFSDDFQDYVKIVYAKEFETKEGNYNSIAFSIKYKAEIADFLRMMTEISPKLNVVASFHIAMTLDEANAAKADFMKDTQKGVRYPKEWQPMLYGQAKYVLPGIFDYVYFLWAKENPGQPTQYLAKLEADDSTVGIAKSRLMPFDNPREIAFPKNHMYEFFTGAINEYLASGKPSASKSK